MALKPRTPHPRANISFWQAVAMGIGAMVGAGIFALLGQAGAIAGSAVYISFLIGGVIALLSGYSLGRLGARYPAAGGMVEYLVQGFGPGIFSGAMSLMMFAAALVSISLVARTFGIYAFSLTPAGSPPVLTDVFTAGIILFFVLLNLNGARSSARVESIIVFVKVAALGSFAVAALFFADFQRLSPANYPPVNSIFYSLAITFFAYEGFRVITNAAEDIADPAKTLPRAIMTAIFLVMILYVMVAIAVYGNLPAGDVVKAKDFALAEAARPAFGNLGFRIMAAAALLSTASAINAALYAVTNVTYQLAKQGELPSAFGKPMAHSREGLVISGGVILVISLLFNLGEIAVIGSISILGIHCITHIGHLRLIKQTGANLLLILAAIAANATAVALAVYYLAQTQAVLLYGIMGGFGSMFALEFLIHKFSGRRIVARIINHRRHERYGAAEKDS